MKLILLVTFIFQIPAMSDTSYERPVRVEVAEWRQSWKWRQTKHMLQSSPNTWFQFYYPEVKYEAKNVHMIVGSDSGFPKQYVRVIVPDSIRGGLKQRFIDIRSGTPTKWSDWLQRVP